MNDPGTFDRFEELEAGRLLGDLDEAEWKEWRELAERFAEQRDHSLEAVAAAVEAGFAAGRNESLPAGLAEALRGRAGEVFPTDGVGVADKVVDGVFPELFRSPRAAWALAAALSALLVAVILVRPADKPGPELVEVPLEKRAEDLVTPAFTGTDAYAGMSGRVVWSDKFQEGYMELTNLAVNDPSRNQYQLWIVDPGRAKQPVDGGVFDIDSSGTVRVPIDAKLAVRKPQAFVITLEKPGGVVVSEQETVVAISKVGV